MKFMNDYNRRRLLLILLGINVVATGLHYTDNFLAFSRYPAPAWMLPHQVYQAWLVLTPFAIVGYILYTRRVFLPAYLCLGIYSLTSLGGVAHYLFGNLASFSLKMHSLIWFEQVAGYSLVGFLIGSALILQEWRREKDLL